MVNLLEETDKLRDALQHFYCHLRRNAQDTDLEEAMRRLRVLVHAAEPLVSDHEQRFTLAIDQRWGYVQLYSLLDTARRELAREELNMGRMS